MSKKEYIGYLILYGIPAVLIMINWFLEDWRKHRDQINFQKEVYRRIYEKYIHVAKEDGSAP